MTSEDEEKKDKKSFTQHRLNGILLRFPNGNSLSTIWGAGSYSENHDVGFESPYSVERFQEAWNTKMASNDVEVMPGCSVIVKKLLDATFPSNCDGDIFTHLNFTQWLEMVNILNTNK